MKERKDRILNLILPLTAIIALFAVWAVASTMVESQFILPSIADTFGALKQVFAKSEFYLSLLGTILRSFIAFVFSLIFAVLLAVISYKNGVASRLIAPIISVIRALPTIAVILLLLFWTNSQVAPVIVTVLVVLPTIFTNVLTALNSIDKTVCEAARVDGADEKRVFLLIEISIIKPTVLRTIGSGFSLNFKLMVAAEVIAQTAKSIGYMLNTAKVYFETAQMIALVCVAVLIGLIVEGVFNYLSNKSMI